MLLINNKNYAFEKAVVVDKQRKQNIILRENVLKNKF